MRAIEEVNTARVRYGLAPIPFPFAIPAERLVMRAGDLFAFAIRKITSASPCPKICAGRIAQMNQWGWWKCWRNRKTIATWLAEAARRRGHQITDSIALDLLKATFKELRDRRRSPAPPAARTDSADPVQTP